MVNADNTLAVKWDELWTWTKRAMIAMIVDVLLLLLAPLLGAIVLIVCSIGLLIISIIRLIYQYQSAMVFRAISEEPAE